MHSDFGNPDPSQDPELDQTHLSPSFNKSIGKKTYRVKVHFSQTSRETIDDKIMRLIEQELIREESPAETQDTNPDSPRLPES